MHLLTLICFVAATVRGIIVPQAEAEAHFHSPVVNAPLPQGKNVTINGVLTYVSLPQAYDSTQAVLFLTDVFGLPSLDNLLLADEFAAAGYATYAPDYLNGDAIPKGGNVTKWIANHGEAQTTPPLLSVINALKAQGVKQIAATGYCFGGLYTVRLVQNNTITVGTVAHPSLLDVPNDFEVMKAQSHVPLEINSAEFDTGFTPTLAVETDAVMSSYSAGYMRRHFSAVGHGFAVGADPNNPAQVAAKKGAFYTSLAWIQEHLE
ncbi:dienelactone hydrolase endo-1,3,1,4-beta-D-glucanase [Roridomyces roridus]|uniref:Dienelactone hydrolase endo-1,3,1,4-beta-D-glucanase n=1 Tax=Roridomyces roridus TaxID=1738132 RepID=A0AAD7CBC9_9AGAR|nr:dienelactone hydrolase endo-1,3,1,4-beta-D-glucanase [Roridomyces roridus]